MKIKALASTNTTTMWSNEFGKVYLNNYLANQENEDCIGNLNSKVAVIKAQDSNKNVETNTCSISIPANIGLAQTVNLPRTLKACVVARVILTDNVSISDRLMNGSISTVRCQVKTTLYCNICETL